MRLLALLLGCIALPLFAQTNSGELRFKITDASGLGLRCVIDLNSSANQFHAVYATDTAGVLAVPRLPFGRYSVGIRRAGFAPVAQTVEVHSSIPKEFRVSLSIASANTVVQVTESDTLLDPSGTANMERIGSSTIENRITSQPGRSVQNLVNTQPGWLFEGNAVLHPRGSEYQTQFIVDGIPLTENRSPGLGPEIEAEDVESVSVYTAGFPAEFGRKLGGVVELNTVRDTRPGLHGNLELSGGSFNTRDAYAQLQYGWGANTLTVSGDGGATDWYLNPPVVQNFTNRGTTSDFAARYERDLSPNDRVAVSFRHDQARFQVPNEQVQQAAGQRQDRGNDETMGVVSYQHIFSANLVGDVRLMARSLDAGLSSNRLATPIVASQSRGFSEQYLKASLSYHRGRSEWKFGGEGDFGQIEEFFRYQITDPSQFDPGTPTSFSFVGHHPDREQSAFVQDTLRLGAWTANLGLRWDHYHLLVDRQAVSPRIAMARYFQRLGLVLHASYDRIFQTPEMENLLLSSSPQIGALNPQVLRLPVEPSHANFFEFGATKEIAGTVRAGVNYFRRVADNFADDDLLLNTSVSFPISFRRASIYGAEAKLDLPQWHQLSGSFSYSYLVGTVSLPVTGGLFLGSEATDALNEVNGRFPISQDQRNTVRTRFRYEVTSRLWFALGAEYGSGLPFEFSGTSEDALAQYGQTIVDRVDFARGRVKPNLSLDASASAELWKREKKSIRVQADVLNLTDRLNLINFAGLFSGNTVLPPRSYQLRLNAGF